MKKKFIISLLICFSLQHVFAQIPTQAEIDKMMKQANDAMKKYGNDSLVNKSMKDAKEKQAQVSEAMKNQKTNNNTGTNSVYNSDPGSYGNVDNWKFPPKNIALLSALPKKVFTKTELVIFLDDLYTQLSKKMPAGVASSVQSMVAQYKNDGNKMGDAAVFGWYTSHKEEAILLIIKAAALKPDNGLLLNNCAALLNMSGIEQKAIPILKYVLQSYPNNAMLLNNLGQAYAGLGETDTAMIYFGRCIKISPEHPEACGTAGQIEATKGNTEKAVQYFEKSIKKAYSTPAALKLSKIKKDAKLLRLIRPRIKLPVYFNFFKYDLPAQCISTDDAVRADAEHKAFRKMIDIQSKAFGAKYAELVQKKTQRAMQIMNANGVGRVVNKNEFIAQPYYTMCNIMARDVLSEYEKELAEFHSKTVKVYAAEMAVLESEYQQKYRIMMNAFEARCPGGEGASHVNCPTEEEICKAKNELANAYLPKFAYLTEEMQKKAKLIFGTYFDELVYWHYLVLHPISNDDFKIKFYEFIEQYLVMMGGICQTKIIEPCEFKPITTTKESNNIKDVTCPLDLGISFIIGHIELDCDKFSIEGGEGLKFKYEKDFKTRQSTMNIGIGIGLDLGYGVEIGAAEYAFIKFDGDGRYSDAGIKTEASVEAGVGNVKVKAEVGSTLGIESGWDFNEGPFKYFLVPAPEVQQNKNVKIYKGG